MEEARRIEAATGKPVKRPDTDESEEEDEEEEEERSDEEGGGGEESPAGDADDEAVRWGRGSIASGPRLWPL